MPKTKPTNVSSSDTDSDLAPDNRTPMKKARTARACNPAATPEEGERSWEIGRNRFVKLTEFKGKWYVNIREFFNGDGGEMKPGKKGIMLTMEQWQKFKTCLPEVEEAIKKNV